LPSIEGIYRNAGEIIGMSASGYTHENWPPPPVKQPHVRPGDVPPFATHERPLTDREIAALQDLQNQPPPSPPSRALWIKPAIWAAIAVACGYGIYDGIAHADHNGNLAGAALLLVIPALIATIVSSFHAWEENEFRSTRSKPNYQQYIDDGYATVETYAPSRVVAIAYDEDVGVIHVFELEKKRLLWTPGDWPVDSGLMSSRDTDEDDDDMWPNDYFSMAYTRLHRMPLGVTLLGEPMTAERDIDTEEIDGDAFMAYGQRHDLDDGGVHILNTTIESLLKKLVQKPSPG
jgi:hypothetical protein